MQETAEMIAWLKQEPKDLIALRKPGMLWKTQLQLYTDKRLQHRTGCTNSPAELIRHWYMKRSKSFCQASDSSSTQVSIDWLIVKYLLTS